MGRKVEGPEFILLRLDNKRTCKGKFINGCIQYLLIINKPRDVNHDTVKFALTNRPYALLCRYQAPWNIRLNEQVVKGGVPNVRDPLRFSLVNRMSNLL